MSKIYVVSEIGYEYNDEVYSVGCDGDALTAPSGGFSSEDKAKEWCLNKIRRTLRNDLYAYDHLLIDYNTHEDKIEDEYFEGNHRTKENIDFQAKQIWNKIYSINAVEMHE